MGLGHLLQKASINSMAHWSRVCFWWSLWMSSSKIGRIQQCDGPCPTTFTTLLCSFSISGKTTHLKVTIVISLSLRIGPETRAKGPSSWLRPILMKGLCIEMRYHILHTHLSLLNLALARLSKGVHSARRPMSHSQCWREWDAHANQRSNALEWIGSLVGRGIPPECAVDQGRKPTKLALLSATSQLSPLFEQRMRASRWSHRFFSLSLRSRSKKCWWSWIDLMHSRAVLDPLYRGIEWTH